jgi:hypothetical protein
MNEMKWQPIETAPKEEDARFLVFGGLWRGEVYGPYSNQKITLVEWNYGRFNVADSEYYAPEIGRPTHWMPLPKEPQS